MKILNQKEKPPEEFYESLNSIRKVGNVINQITVRMHMLGYVEDEKCLRQTITNLNDIILDIKIYYFYPIKLIKTMPVALSLVYKLPYKSN